MIKTVHLQNFKCLLDVRVDLDPFTVLIGPNDSGKTSFLEAIQLLGKTTQGDLQEQVGAGIAPSDPRSLVNLVWRKERDRKIRWHVLGEVAEPFEYHLELSPVQTTGDDWLKVSDGVVFDPSFFEQGNRNNKLPWVANYLHQFARNRTMLSFLAQSEKHSGFTGPKVNWLARVLASTEIYHLNPYAMREKAIAQSSPSLSPTGNNLASVLNSLLTGPDRLSVIALEKQLHEAIPSLQGVSTPVAQDGHGGAERRVDYALSGPDRPPVTIPSNQVSDGAILLTAFLALAYGDTPQILFVEEPENGLHPSRLQMVIDILRKISKGEVGNQARQVILTTHSPILLNFVNPEEVRIFQRDEAGATRVSRMDKIPNIDRLQKEFAPGELWYLFGEEELVKDQKA